jgi:hypothetical protein
MANTDIPQPPTPIIDCTQKLDTATYMSNCVDLVNGSNEILILCTDILGISSFFAYGLFWYLQRKGIVEPSPMFNKIAKWVLFACLIAPGAVRLGLSNYAILYFSIAIAAVGAFIKFRSKLGI